MQRERQSSSSTKLIRERGGAHLYVDEKPVDVSGAGPRSDATLPSIWTVVAPSRLAQALSNQVELVVFSPSVAGHVLDRAIGFIRTAAPTAQVAVIALDEVRRQRTDVDLVFSPQQPAAADLYRGALGGTRLARDLEEVRHSAANGAGAASRGAEAVRRILVPVALMGVWGLGVALFQPPAYILPSPLQVASAFAEQPVNYIFHAATTAAQAFAGFVVGNLSGIALAILLFRFVRLRALTLPALIALQAVPIVAIAPLLGVWLGTGYASKVAMAAIICFFPMVVNTLQAFSTVERDYQDLFTIYRASFKRRLLHLLIPSATPSIVAALRIAGGLAVVGSIVAEMTGADRGLGYLILNGAYRLETTILFVAMVLASILGMVFFRIPDALKVLLPVNWRRGLFSRGDLNV